MGIRCRKLELINFTSTPGVFIANVTPVTLTDGGHYVLDIPYNIAFPVGLTGTEVFNISVQGATPITIIVGDCRARSIFSERVKKCRRLCMKYTAVSIASTEAAGVVTPVPAFIALDGIDGLPGLGQE